MLMDDPQWGMGQSSISWCSFNDWCRTHDYSFSSFRTFFAFESTYEQVVKLAME